MRTALDWRLDQGEADSVVAAGWALAPYWTLRERIAEGRGWMRGAMASGELSPAARARALAVEAGLAYIQGDYEFAFTAATEALDACRALGDEHARALAQLPLGMMRAMAGDAHAGLAMLEESRALFGRAGDEWGASLAMVGLGWAANCAREERPVEQFEEAVARARGLGLVFGMNYLSGGGRRRAMRGETDAAKRALGEALRRATAFKAGLGIATYFEMIADLATENGEDQLAARLFGAAEAGFAAMGAPILPLVGERDDRLRALRERLGESSFAQEYQAGKTLGTDHAVSQALAWTGTDSPATEGLSLRLS